MRYFIAKNGAVVVDKQCLGGDDTRIDDLVDKFKLNHPNLVVSELDQVTFDATPCTPPLNAAQQAWATFKATTPTALQAIVFLARYLGLE